MINFGNGKNYAFLEKGTGAETGSVTGKEGEESVTSLFSAQDGPALGVNRGCGNKGGCFL